jgi:hypothetical protein
LPEQRHGFSGLAIQFLDCCFTDLDKCSSATSKCADGYFISRLQKWICIIA